ncbi:hypothetical protein TYRP_006873 [Tyrophagus putrescentiae]|nr:hypothetical protein TYRP_006873 [Tyrophagus putrescentiae]
MQASLRRRLESVARRSSTGRRAYMKGARRYSCSIARSQVKPRRRTAVQLTAQWVYSSRRCRKRRQVPPDKAPRQRPIKVIEVDIGPDEAEDGGGHEEVSWWSEA